MAIHAQLDVHAFVGAAWKAINRAKKLMVFRVKPMLIWFLTNILSTPVESTPLHSLPCVVPEWRSGVDDDFPKEKKNKLGDQRQKTWSKRL